MCRLIAAVGSGIAAAVVAGFLFWIINRSYEVNNVGLLRRQDWPISDPWMWAAAGFVVGLVSSLIWAARRAAYLRAVRAVAADRGWAYAESFALPAGAAAMPTFAGWSSGRHAMTGTTDGVPVAVFDCTTIIPGDESDTVTERTVALVPADSLPTFDLRPRSVGRRLLGLVGFEGITFDADAAGPAEADAIRQFTERFQVLLGDPLEVLKQLAEDDPPDHAEHEAALRRLFAPGRMAAVNDFPEYALEASHNFLAVWHGSVVQPARDRPALWTAAVSLRAILTRAGAAGEPVIPAQPGAAPAEQARRIRNSLFGGLVGSFGGFVVSSILMPLLFFGGREDRGPGAKVLLLPLVFVGCVVAGGALGSLVG
jgi:hypothetical protein